MIWYFIAFHILSFQRLDVDKTNTHLKFDIVLRDKVIGELQATRSQKEAKTYYQSTTNITARIITEIMVNYKYDVVFSEGYLKKADVLITVNNKPHAETNTEWLGKYYVITENSKSKNLSKTIHYSTILMYFEEPKDVSFCFSEEDGTKNTIIPLGNHSYKKVNSKGKENTYYYKHGKLIKAEIDGGLVSFQMIAK